jgi:hypothetical protein
MSATRMLTHFLLAATCVAQTGPNTTALHPAKTVAIVGGKLLTITHGTIEDGVLVLSGGKIVAVGTAASTKVPNVCSGVCSCVWAAL